MTQLRFNPDLLKVPLYIAGKSIEAVQAEMGLDDIVKLGSNENSLGPSPMAVAAAYKAMTEGHRYPNYWEHELRAKIAARLGEGITEQHILTGNGGCDVLRMVTQSFMTPDGESITANATFPMFAILTTMFGGRTVEVPVTSRQAFDLPAILDAITPQTRLVFLCTPNNPTGLIIRQAEADAFMDRLPAHVVAVFDECYGGFATHAERVDSRRYIREGRNVVSVRSFSKTAGLANFRVGYAVGRPDLIEYLHHAQMPFNTGSVSLAAAAASLDDHAYHQRTADLVASERAYLYAVFDALDLSYLETEANFILLVDLPMDAQALVDAVLRKGVIVRWGGSMGMPDAVRVTFGQREENEKLAAALSEVLQEARATA